MYLIVTQIEGIRIEKEEEKKSWKESEVKVKVEFEDALYHIVICGKTVTP